MQAERKMHPGATLWRAAGAQAACGVPERTHGRGAPTLLVVVVRVRGRTHAATRFGPAVAGQLLAMLASERPCEIGRPARGDVGAGPREGP
jgi:hypothetical protein